MYDLQQLQASKGYLYLFSPNLNSQTHKTRQLHII